VIKSKYMPKMHCRECGGDLLDFSKMISLAKDGTTPIFQYWVLCLECGEKHTLPRTPAIVAMMTKKKWQRSYNYQKRYPFGDKYVHKPKPPRPVS
jgi:hypothetical protein